MGHHFVRPRSGYRPALLFAHEVGWVYCKGSPGGDGGGCYAEQRHGQHGADYDDWIAGICLVDDVSQQATG